MLPENTGTLTGEEHEAMKARKVGLKTTETAEAS